MAIISFEDYGIDKAVFITNKLFEGADQEGRLHTNVSFSGEIGIDYESEKAYVLIKNQIGDLEPRNDSEKKAHIPFQMEVEIRGIFSLSLGEFSDVEELKNILSSNAIAILYPYLRSTVSTLTSLMNNFPTYTLPVINFAETLKENDLVSYIGFENIPNDLFSK